MFYKQLAFVTLSLALIAVETRGATAQTTEKPKAEGCPLSVAIQRVDDFVQKKTAELSNLSTDALQKVSKIIEKANKPGVAIKEQLSASEINQFQAARHMNILFGAEKIEFGALKRDAHLLQSLYDIAKYTDLYELKREQLGADSPLRFYFAVMEAMRIAEPRIYFTDTND